MSQLKIKSEINYCNPHDYATTFAKASMEFLKLKKAGNDVILAKLTGCELYTVVFKVAKKHYNLFEEVEIC